MIFQNSLGFLLFFFSISNYEFLPFIIFRSFLLNSYIVSFDDRNVSAIFYHSECERLFVPSHVKNF